ncbi:MAG: hypothetical protein ACYDGX_05380 [Thermoleophilia bacterium]
MGEAAYLIISKEDINNWRPGLTPLLGPESLHPGWQLVDTVAAGTDKEVLIFKLRKGTF